MFLHLSYSDGNPLQFNRGFPPHYSGFEWHGAEVSHAEGKGIRIIIQEVISDLFTLRHQSIQWSSQVRLRYDYSREGIHTRIATRNGLHECIKGAGEVQLQEGTFSTLLSKAWTGILKTVENEPLELVDIVWSTRFLEKLIPSHHLFALLRNVHRRIPTLAGEPFRRQKKDMHLLLNNIWACHDAGSERLRYMEEQLHLYFRLMLAEIEGPHWLGAEIPSKDLFLVYRARDLIAENLERHYTIPQISRMIGMNEYKLKGMFQKVMGRGPFEYMSYLRCQAARNEILYSDESLKAFYKRAGYKSLSSFVTGFRKILQCTPGELRRNKWNTDVIKPVS